MYHPNTPPGRRIAAGFLLLATSCQGPDTPPVEDRTSRLYPDRIQGRDGGPDPSPVPTAARIQAAADLPLYLRFGLHHNGGLRAAYERWRAAVEEITSASAMPDPTLSFAQFIEEVQTRTGPQERRYGVTQTLPWFGKLRLRGEVAAGRAEELWYQVLDQRRGVRREIALAFYEYGYLGRLIRITSDVLAVLRRLEPSVQGRVRGGAGQEDLLRLQLEIGKVEDDLAKQKEVRTAVSSRLAGTMNWYGGGLLPLPELEAPQGEPVPAADWQERAAIHNPKLRELEQQERTRRRALDLQERSRWPDLHLGVDYIETGPARAAGTPGSGDDPLALRVSFNLPVWTQKYDAAERAAEHRIQAARQALQQFRFNLRSEIELAAFQLGDASRQLGLYRDTLLPRSRELMNVTRAAYRAGTTRMLDLIDSERSLLTFELAYWRAARDYRQVEARLEALAGDSIR